MSETASGTTAPLRVVRETLLDRLVEEAKNAQSAEDLLHLAKAWEILRSPGAAGGR